MGQAPLKVSGIDHVVLYVRDLSRARKFYTDLLGMKVAHENSRQCFLRCGPQMVALFEARDGSEIPGGSEMNHMALRLESGEYQQVRAILEAAEIKVSGRRNDPHCIYFSDPDGHRLQLLTSAEQE